MTMFLDPIEVLTLAIAAILWAAGLWIIGVPWWLTVVAGVAVACVLHHRERGAR